MKEIIVKQDDVDKYTSITTTEDNKLKIRMRIYNEGMCETFTLEEIDDLQEAISIMKDRLERNLSNKKDIVTPTEPKDANIVSDNEKKGKEMPPYGGEIADFPIEVVEKMLENQVLQGNPRDVSVFEKRNVYGLRGFGFDWGTTDDGHYFWHDVILNKNFSLFFKRYPKKDSL